MKNSRAFYIFASALTLGLSLGYAAPAMADLDRGYEAWARGDYSTAVNEWRDLAAQGNPDAQFNMAQAYRLGRGVEKNEAQAEVLIAKAAAQGHIRAIDTYGLLLFQNGRREEAMPYVMASAERGNPRAQYLLGIGHFNGDLVNKDWVRAYALMTLSNAEGFEPAKAGIAQMDQFIPLPQRQQAQDLARTLKRNADMQRKQQLASNDLGLGAEIMGTQSPPAKTGARPVAVAVAPVTAPVAASATAPIVTTRIPQPLRPIDVAPSIAAAQAAVAEASRVTGVESPAEAGADFARPLSRPVTTTRPAPATAAVSPPPRATAPTPRAPAASAPPPAASNGPWRVQLGAFSVHSNAGKLWSRVSGNSAITGKEKFLVSSGKLTLLQVGGYASRASAQTACNALKKSGQTCVVTR